MPRNSSLTRAKAATSRSAMANFAPAFAKARARPKPIPLAPPVMKAVRPLTSVMSFLLVTVAMDPRDETSRTLRRRLLFRRQIFQILVDVRENLIGDAGNQSLQRCQREAAGRRNLVVRREARHVFFENRSGSGLIEQGSHLGFLHRIGRVLRKRRT